MRFYSICWLWAFQGRFANGVGNSVPFFVPPFTGSWLVLGPTLGSRNRAPRQQNTPPKNGTKFAKRLSFFGVPNETRKLGQDHPCWGQDGQDGPRWPQDGSKMDLAGPRLSQDGTRWPARCPEMFLRWPQAGPRWPQDGARWSQDVPKMSLDSPESSKVRPKMIYYCSKWSQHD